jgi:hypothetical protein
MDLIKPIYVKRWLNDLKYINYVFDVNKDNKYDSNTIVINEYIFQDNNYEDAFNKIVFYILKYDKDVELPFYFWDQENLMYEFNEIKWPGYNINPFKSKDRDSEALNEPLNITAKNKLLQKTNINLVFYNDFKYNIKYYFNNSLKLQDFNKKVKDVIKNEDKIVKLYNKVVKNTKITLEEYNDILFESKIHNLESLMQLFDKLDTNDKMQIIQFAKNENNAIYKLCKKHTFISEKELSFIFNISNLKEESLNIYYKSKNNKLSIFTDGTIDINFKYPIDNGNKWDKITSDKKEFITYINEYVDNKLIFTEKDINLRLKYMVDNIDYPTLLKKIGIYSNVFEAIIFKNDKKRNSGYYIYKRVNDIFNNNFDVTAYVKSRLIVGLSEDEIVKELMSFGYNKTESINIIKDELKLIGDIGFNNLDKNPNIIEGTYIVVKKSGSGFEIDIKNCKSHIELDNIKFWLTKIIEDTRDNAKKTLPEPVIKKEKTPPPPKKQSSSSSSNKNDGEDEDFGDFSKFDGGGGGKNDIYKNYLINRLRNADKELYQDKNKSRKCQREHQPVVLSKEEYDELKAKDYDKLLDNVIEYGSNPNIKNYYTCPRLWCPASKIPLDDTKENPKCPGENEEPMNMNKDMKNLNKPRYVYLIKNIILPCCGKKKPKDEPISEKKVSDKQAKVSYDDKNYIMNKVPLPYKNRYGDIINELYKILKPDEYDEYTKHCLSPNNINKKECILRKSILDIKDIPFKYDNIINVVSFLLGKTKKEFINDVIDKLDILTYLSLDNGNVCKDFVDIKPIIYEENEELYQKFITHMKKFNSVKLDIPNISDDSKEDNYKKSRLLYIYKSYLKFIKYLSSDDFPYDKGIVYLNSLVAILYNKLILMWDIEKTQDNIQINVECPYFVRNQDLIQYLDTSPKFIMIIKENNFYEPIISRSVNMKQDKKTFDLNQYPVVKNILDNCYNTEYLKDYEISIFANKENIKILNKILREHTEFFNFETLIINTDYTIDKIILKNNTILKFKPQSIVVLSFLIKEFKIKSVVFFEDIKNQELNIKLNKDNYAKFKEQIDKIKELGFVLEIGDNIIDTKELMRNKINIVDEKYEIKTEKLILPFDSKYTYYKYIDETNKKTKKIQQLRLLIKNKLTDKKFTDNYYKDLYKKSRKKIIKELLKEFSKNSDINDIKILLEEIPAKSIKSIKKWYYNSLLYTKYNYITELSDTIKETDNELIFSQYIVADKIPNKIMNYHDALPNNIDNIDENIKTYKIENTKKLSDDKIPSLFIGEENVLNSKWTKYKKKIWFKLRYIKNNYNEKTIEEFFNYLLVKLNIDILSYQDVINKCNEYYLDVFNEGKKDKNKALKISALFKDPHFYLEYLKEMNKINKTKKSFKTLTIFIDTYFNKSTKEEKKNIINNLVSSNSIKYPSDIHLFSISKILNVTILIIHNRSEYGKGVKLEKRADDKDLNITTSIYKAGNNINKRPIIILYRKIDKTNISYSIIKNIEYQNYFYMELQDAPDDIKNKVFEVKSADISSSTSTSPI